MYHVLTDWSMFVHLLLSVVNPPQSKATDEIHDHFFVNSMIESQTPERRRASAEKATQGSPSGTPRAPLSSTQRKENAVHALADLTDTLHLLFLPSFGCIHLRCEWILHSKANTEMPRWYTRDHDACGTQCYVCNKSYEKYILPIVYEGTRDFCGSSHFAKCLRENKLSYDNPEVITNSLWESEDWRKSVFGKKTVAKYNVFSFFFQLTATGILTFETSKETKGLYCVLGRDSNDKMKYKHSKYWKGFTFRSRRHGAATIRWEDLSKRQQSIRKFTTN